MLAQEPHSLWVTGAAVVSVHDPGRSDSYLGPALGGAAPGVVVGIHKAIRSRLRVGFEFGYDGLIEGEQSRRTGSSFLTTHRDTTMTGLLSWSERDGGRATTTFVAGETLAYRNTVRHVGSDETDLVVGLSGGVDVAIRLSPRIFVTPTFRLHWLADRDRTSGGLPKRGVGSFITRLGVGLGVGL